MFYAVLARLQNYHHSLPRATSASPRFLTKIGSLARGRGRRQDPPQVGGTANSLPGEPGMARLIGEPTSCFPGTSP